MADWYVSSVANAAIAQWAATTSYVVGNIVRQLAAQTYPNDRVFRVSAITTGISGGSEPSWNRNSNATTTDGGVTWTECTGQSNHQQDNGVTNTWTAPAAHFECLDSSGKNVLSAGDRVFASSDHNETIAASGHTLLTATSTTNPIKCVSVDRTTGNIPPLSADITYGATVSCTAASSTLTISNASCYFIGFTFSCGTSGSSSSQIQVTNVVTIGSWYLKDCTFTIVGTGSTGGVNTMNSANGAEIVLENPTFNFGSTSHSIRFNGVQKLTIKKGISFTGSIPSVFITDGNSSNGKGPTLISGCDLSSITGTLLASLAFRTARMQFVNCKINGSVTLVTNGSDTNSVAPTQDVVEFINCDSSNTNYRNALYFYQGVVTTETTITRTGGATDGAQKASRKVVTVSTLASHISFICPLRYVLYAQNTLTGNPLTATVEIISSTTLNNDELWGEVEYLGDSGSSESSFVDNTITDILTTAAAQTTSSATWDSSPATPVTQKLSLTFTPQKAGLVKFTVYIAKASTTLYIDHKITIA